MRKKIVRRSLSETNERIADLPLFLNRIYLNRGVSSPNELALNLAQLEKSDNLKGLEQAVRLITDAIITKQKILVVGDFDCDGATSTALSMLVFRHLKADCDYLVPNRFEYGYGLTPEIVDLAAQQQPNLIITVDNGISSIEGVERAKSLGIKVLITDHHLPGDCLPKADAIVNPNQPGCQFLSKNAAGVGVIFYVLNALRAELRQMGWFQKTGIPELNMAVFLDLLALGTVADLVPLDLNNRILVEQGLRRIRAGICRPGIKALLDQAGKHHSQVKSSDMGFIVGPRLNAAGRIADMSIGIECLLAESEAHAQSLAARLDHLNQERKQIEHEMKLDADELVAEITSSSEMETKVDKWGVCLFQPHWHQGVIGILASRIKEKLHRPTIIFAPADDDPHQEDPLLKGSARSISGLHMRDTLDLLAKRYPHLLQKFGGHAMAAGMTIRLQDFEEFSTVFDQLVKDTLSSSDIEAVLLTDGDLPSEERTIQNIEMLEKAGPWGQGFPEPVFDGCFDVVQSKVLKDKHLKLVLSDRQGAMIDAIQFNSEWCQEILPASIRVVYRANINEFRGRQSVQFLIDYIEPVVQAL